MVDALVPAQPFTHLLDQFYAYSRTRSRSFTIEHPSGCLRRTESTHAFYEPINNDAPRGAPVPLDGGSRRAPRRDSVDNPALGRWAHLPGVPSHEAPSVPKGRLDSLRGEPAPAGRARRSVCLLGSSRVAGTPTFAATASGIERRVRSIRVKAPRCSSSNSDDVCSSTGRSPHPSPRKPPSQRSPRSGCASTSTPRTSHRSANRSAPS